MGPLRTDAGESRRRWWAALLVVWIASLAWAWTRIDLGWLPHDEGALALPAERFLQGELSHLDFDDPYTGGLAWLNAIAFRVFGTSFFSLRIPVFLAFAAWVPAVFWIATRFIGPLGAIAATAAAVAWSYPNYPAPMPSWYVLFAATLGTAALFKHLEGGRRWWLVAAGACGGAACLAKVTGLHFVAAGLLFFAWKEPGITGGAAAGRRRGFVYPAVLSAGLVAVIAGLVAHVWPVAARRGFMADIEQFVLPEALVAAVVVHRAWASSRAPDATRFRALLGMALPFLAGFLAPVALFVAPYAARGGVGALVEGVLVLPMKRLQHPTTTYALPPLWTALWTLPFVAAACMPRPRGRTSASLLVGGLATLAAAAVWASSRDAEVLVAVEQAFRHFLPALAIFGAWGLARGGGRGASPDSDRAALLLSVAAFLSLVQFPFGAQIYFYYSAPCVVLAAAACFRARGIAPASRPGLAVIAAFIVAWPLMLPASTHYRDRFALSARLESGRCGLLVPPADAAEYDRVIALLRAHARGGYVWAGPDLPEVPFLAGLRNPTRTIYDLFDRDFDDPRARTARIMRALDEHGVTAVAVIHTSEASGDVQHELAEALAARFPKFEATGQFVVAWNE